jgi:hypothetical protein
VGTPWWRVAAPGIGLVVVALGVLIARPAVEVSGLAVAAPRPGQAAVAAYFDALNAAGARGTTAQQAFFGRTQDPDFPIGGGCGLAGLTVRAQPDWNTLRTDPDWVAPGTSVRPRGTVFRVAVTVDSYRNGVTVGSQIGTEHVVLLTATGYGFAPCATP